MGMTHIWFGFDHLAFLAGLLVAAGNAKNLLKVITCFTVAHSITLILAVMDIIAAPSKWVEVLIALTIVYVAVENFFFRTYPHRTDGDVFLRIDSRSRVCRFAGGYPLAQNQFSHRPLFV